MLVCALDDSVRLARSHEVRSRRSERGLPLMSFLYFRLNSCAPDRNLSVPWSSKLSWGVQSDDERTADNHLQLYHLAKDATLLNFHCKSELCKSRTQTTRI